MVAELPCCCWTELATEIEAAIRFRRRERVGILGDFEFKDEGNERFGEGFTIVLAPNIFYFFFPLWRRIVSLK